MTMSSKGGKGREEKRRWTYTTALAILGLSLELRGLFNVRLLLLIQKNEQQSMNDEQDSQGIQNGKEKKQN